MSLENLPRPWLLAALTGLRITELVTAQDEARPDRRPPSAPPRPEPRRWHRRELAREGARGARCGVGDEARLN